MIGSEKFGGNSWPSGGSRENVGGEMCTSLTRIGATIMATPCSMIGVESANKQNKYGLVNPINHFTIDKIIKIIKKNSNK